MDRNAFFAALAANLLLWGTLQETLSQDWCGYLYCRGGQRQVLPAGFREDWGRQPPVRHWEVYLANPRAEEDGPGCTAGPPPKDEWLLQAPILDVLHLNGDHRGFFACLRVAPDGRVARARLLGTIGDPALERAFVALMERSWRFAPPAAGSPASWQRVWVRENWSWPLT